MNLWAITLANNHPEGLPDGWPIGKRSIATVGDVQPGEVAMDDAQLQQQYAGLAEQKAAWDAAVRANEPYLITDFFDRLSPEQRATIRTLAKQSDQIADLWDNLLALRDGIECPPDGSTPGRAKSAAAFAACVQIFGQSEANRLFARP